MKILSNLDDNNKPVIVRPPVVKQLQANYKFITDLKPEQLSSLTGVVSKGLYIAKINQLNDEIEYPSLFVISEGYFHIKRNTSQIPQGTYGKTWVKRTHVICNEDEQNEFKENDTN